MGLLPMKSLMCLAYLMDAYAIPYWQVQNLCKTCKVTKGSQTQVLKTQYYIFTGNVGGVANDRLLLVVMGPKRASESIG